MCGFINRDGDILKEVKRFKCDHCDKTAARASTMEKHEKQCIKNPNCLNCYLCEHAYAGDYDEHWNSFEGNDMITPRENVPHCAYYEEPLQTCYGGSGNIAETCSMYRKSEDICFERDYDEACSNLKKNGCDY